MTKGPAARVGAFEAANDSGASPPASPSAFQRELDRARRHLARLEAEEAARLRPPASNDRPVQFDESPAFARACNAIIWAVVLLPILLAVLTVVRRLTG